MRCKDQSGCSSRPPSCQSRRFVFDGSKVSVAAILNYLWQYWRHRAVWKLCTNISNQPPCSGLSCLQHVASWLPGYTVSWRIPTTATAGASRPKQWIFTRLKLHYKLWREMSCAMELEFAWFYVEFWALQKGTFVNVLEVAAVLWSLTLYSTVVTVLTTCCSTVNTLQHSGNRTYHLLLYR